METDYEVIEYIQNVITKLLTTAGFKVRVQYEHSLVKGLVFNIPLIHLSC